MKLYDILQDKELQRLNLVTQHGIRERRKDHRLREQHGSRLLINWKNDPKIMLINEDIIYEEEETTLEESDPSGDNRLIDYSEEYKGD